MEQFFRDFALAISPALNVLLQSVFAALAGLAAVWIKNQIDLARQRLTADQEYAFDLFIGMAVRAAQQIYDEKDGEGKKDYVVSMAESYALKAGFVIDGEELEAKIEAAVFEVKPTPQG